jgi:Fe-S cluster assembly scaffold protein SufB
MENNHRTQTKGDLITHQRETMHLSNSTTKVAAGNAHYAKYVEGCTAKIASLGSQFVLDVGNQGTSRMTTGPLLTTKLVKVA